MSQVESDSTTGNSKTPVLDMGARQVSPEDSLGLFCSSNQWVTDSSVHQNPKVPVQIVNIDSFQEPTGNPNSAFWLKYIEYIHYLKDKIHYPAGAGW